jgi:hypothetical protein
MYSLSGFFAFGIATAPKNAPKRGKKSLSSDMTIPSYPYKLAILKDRKGDLTKSWYVEYYVYSEEKNELVRVRNRISPELDTVKKRREYAKEEINKINLVLLNGYYLKKEPDIQQDQESATLLLLQSLNEVIDIESPFLRDKSIGTYRTAINRARQFFKNDIDIYTVQESDIYRFRDFLIRDGNRPKTANKTISLLRSLYLKLSKRYKLPDNPFNLKKLPETQLSTSNIF